MEMRRMNGKWGPQGDGKWGPCSEKFDTCFFTGRRVLSTVQIGHLQDLGTKSWTYQYDVKVQMIHLEGIGIKKKIKRASKKKKTGSKKQ